LAEELRGLCPSGRKKSIITLGVLADYGLVGRGAAGPAGIKRLIADLEAILQAKADGAI
jgi:hypothetical protein